MTGKIITKVSNGEEFELDTVASDYYDSIDWHYWTLLPRLRLSEAAALLIGIDPDRTDDLAKDERPEARTHLRSYRMMDRMIERANEAGFIKAAPSLRQAVVWAHEHDVECMTGIKKFVGKLPPMLPFRNILRLKSATIEKLEAKIEELEATIQSLRRDNIDNGSPKSMGNIYRVLFAVARDKYEYKSEGNNSAAKGIAGAVALTGFDSPKEQTIRTLLEESKAYLHERSIKFPVTPKQK